MMLTLKQKIIILVCTHKINACLHKIKTTEADRVVNMSIFKNSLLGSSFKFHWLPSSFKMKHEVRTVIL